MVRDGRDERKANAAIEEEQDRWCGRRRRGARQTFRLCLAGAERGERTNGHRGVS